MIVPKVLTQICHPDGPADTATLDVYADCERRHLVATNGHALVVLPMEPDPEEVSGPISQECVKFADSQTKGHLVRRAESTEVDGVQFPHPERQPYPNWQGVKPTPPTQTLILDATLLYRLAQALHGTTGTGKPLRVTLQWHDPNDLLTVTKAGATAQDGYGWLMPVRQPTNGHHPVPDMTQASTPAGREE